MSVVFLITHDSQSSSTVESYIPMILLADRTKRLTSTLSCSLFFKMCRC